MNPSLLILRRVLFNSSVLHPNSRSLASLPLAMEDTDTAVVKHFAGADRFTLSFVLRFNNEGVVVSGTDDGGTRRQFNLDRPLQEPGRQFMDRLVSNVEKVVNKKNKKKRKKADAGDAEAASSSAPKARFVLEDGTDLEMSPDVAIGDVLVGRVGERAADRRRVHLDVLGQRFVVSVNPPLVDRMSLPDVTMCGFDVFPRKLSLQFADVASSSFLWYVSAESHAGVDQDKLKNVDPAKSSWNKRTDGFFFRPSASDVGRFLKVVCTPGETSSGRRGADFSVVSKSVVSAGPGPCPFEDRQLFTAEVCPPAQLRTVSYNLLADLYADSDFSRSTLHPHCPPYALDIDYRRQLIAKELAGYNADLLCLQEVDAKVFTGDLEPLLKSEFEGEFGKKGGQVSEGCACFWRREKLECLDRKALVLSERLETEEHLRDILQRVETNPALKESVAQRTTVLQTVALRSRHFPKKAFVVGNTHLYFRPDADHIRLLQIGIIFRELEKAAEEVLKECESVEECSLILCGDFNSTPPFGVLEFVRAGAIPEDHADWRSCAGEEVSGLALRHGRAMDSACGSPPFTNYTQGFKDCLDYIFYQSDSLRVAQVVPFPSEEELSAHVAIPNIVFPSDHVACVADLVIIH